MHVDQATRIPPNIDQEIDNLSNFITSKKRVDPQVVQATIKNIRDAVDNAQLELQLKAWTVLKATAAWGRPKFWRAGKLTETENNAIKEAMDKCLRHLDLQTNEDFNTKYIRLIDTKDKETKKMVRQFYRHLNLPSLAGGNEFNKGIHPATLTTAVGTLNVAAVEVFLLRGPSVAELNQALRKTMAILDARTDIPDREKAWQIVEALVHAGAAVNKPLIELPSRFQSIIDPGLRKYEKIYSLLQRAVFAGRKSLVQELVKRGAPWDVAYARHEQNNPLTNRHKIDPSQTTLDYHWNDYPEGKAIPNYKSLEKDYDTSDPKIFARKDQIEAALAATSLQKA